MSIPPSRRIGARIKKRGKKEKGVIEKVADAKNVKEVEREYLTFDNLLKKVQQHMSSNFGGIYDTDRSGNACALPDNHRMRSGYTDIVSEKSGNNGHYKRLITIEEKVREFNLIRRDGEGNVLNNVVHLVTRETDDPSKDVTMQRLLTACLTMHPNALCVAEMKSNEARIPVRYHE